MKPALEMLDASAVSRLRDVFRGEIVLRNHSDYDRARAVWNATVDRYPALVARCAVPADVTAALRFAREQDLVIAVRGGAHSYAGFSTCDGGVVIDLSPMRGVQVDAEHRVARANGGALLRELDEASQVFGLACPNGVVGHTGVAGLTLGGGLGRLMRKHGLTIDNLLAVDLVTADGRLVRVSEEEHADLFWALRGAGANFGVATSFEFRLHPVGPAVVAGVFAYPVARAQEVAALLQQLAESSCDDLSATMRLATAPAEPPFLPELAGRPIVIVEATHTGDPNGDGRELRALRELGPLVDTIAPTSYLALQRALDDYYAWGQRNYWKGVLLTALAPEAIHVLLTHLGDAPGPGCAFGLITMGGAVARVPESATAFSGRKAGVWLLVDARWHDPAADEVHFAWGRGAMEAVAPYAASANYVNDLGRSADLRAVYGDEKYERLVGLKRVYDPDNVFRLNQNIRP
jgi:FAD/FMN-containing dehydrogenase